MAARAHNRKKAAKKVLRVAGKEPELNCLVLPTDHYELLLPTSVVEEVIDFEQPVPVELAPPWLLGYIGWSDRQVPLVSFGALIDGSEVGEIPERSRIVILKSLNVPGRVPWLGLLLSELPRPVTVKPTDLVEVGDEKKSLGVFRRVTLDEGETIVPELDRLTHLVTHAMFGALPITQLDD